MNFKPSILQVSALAASIAFAAAAVAQTAPVAVDGAWARASVQGQSATGAFMKLTAKEPLRLVSVTSPVAGVTDVHEMKMEGDVMRMRAIDGLDLPAGKAVELKPGGYHIMLQDLKAPLAANSKVPLTLTFKDAKGAQSKLELSVPVSVTAPKGGDMKGDMSSMPGMDHSKHKQ